MPWPGFVCLTICFQYYSSFIVAVFCIGGGNWTTNTGLAQIVEAALWKQLTTGGSLSPHSSVD